MTTHIAKEEGGDAAYSLDIRDDLLATFAKFTLRVSSTGTFSIFFLPAIAAQVG